MIAPTVEEQLGALRGAALQAREDASSEQAQRDGSAAAHERRAQVLDYIRTRLELFASRRAAR